MSKLDALLSLEYGEPLPAERRTGHGFPVFGSNGEVGRHQSALIAGPGIVVGRKGSVGKVTWSDDDLWPIDTTYWVNCPPEERRWLYWVLSWLPLHLLDTSTGIPGLNRRDVYELEVYRPEFGERRKIAQILDILDTAIRETEALIDKLKAVKQGLLHDLLTRGIDSNGQLRPPQREAPQLYMESPLGWIPKEWEVVPLDEACTHIVDCPHSTPSFQTEGALVARTMHIKDGVFLEKMASRVSAREYRERIARLEPTSGDLIFTREAPVGEAFVIPEGMQICLGQRVMLLRPQAGKLTSFYLLAQIYSGSVKDRIALLTSGTTNPHLNVSEVKRFEIPLPPPDEQALITDRFSSLGDRIQYERAQLEKLLQQKSGLMDDLLTGRMRVTSLLESVQQSAAPMGT
ncbi:restriction endonuclease subunit S [Pseudomonas sp. P105]|uniref:restriction endonuclease subunit S n=1 Tax=Pseudomonas sp. P105 TaxID=3049542 RepID=UPI0029341439|nr:restriction endonuclease subunit S [Pseudomonas sp. P105]WNZ77853.1 restriction endonuclease subunit S [Pseudomonas sp. P105]